jgi:hypothetical protein
MKSYVISEKIFCYELGLENIDKMLNNGKEVIYSYLHFSINKVISLIERLQDIKQNIIYMSIAKYEKEMLKFKGWKKKNEEKKKKEEIKNEKNKSRNILNDDLKNNLTDKESKYNSNESKSNEKIFPSQNTSSPIKLYMTNMSQKSKSMFEQMKIAYTKLQKNQLKFKNRKYNKTNLNNSIFKSTIHNNNSNDNTNKNKRFYKTMELNGALSYDSNGKEDLKTKYINNLNNITYLEQNDEKSILSSDSEYSLYIKYKEKIYNELSRNDPNMKKINFNFSYIPLNLYCLNEDSFPKKKAFPSNINELLKARKKANDFYSQKKNSTSMISNTPINNNDRKKNDFNKINFKTIEFTKKLKGIIQKYNMKNNDKNLEKAINVVNKKKLISSIIKDFYKDIRLNGYSSFIHNKDINTLYMRKYNKKYDSAEKVHNNIQFHLLKGSNSLPFLSPK